MTLDESFEEKAMRSVAILALVGVLIATSCGCTTFRTPVKPPTGLLFTQVSAPLSVNFDKTPVCTKQGMAKTFYFHDPILTGMNFAWGRAGIYEAAKAAGLETVEYADYRYTMIFGIFGTFEVTAYGN